jgi:hypothetical protein
MESTMVMQMLMGAEAIAYAAKHGCRVSVWNAVGAERDGLYPSEASAIDPRRIFLCVEPE